MGAVQAALSATTAGPGRAGPGGGRVGVAYVSKFFLTTFDHVFLTTRQCGWAAVRVWRNRPTSLVSVHVGLRRSDPVLPDCQ